MLQFSPTNTVHAAINPEINFQGKLDNPDGTNVSDGTYSVVFSIYSASSGGTPIWTETQSVTVSNGIFQVNLGSVTALPGSIDFSSGSLYLGIKVGSDAEMTPRIQFTSVPQAFYAANSGQLGGLSSSAYAQLAANQTFTGTNTFQPTSDITAVKILQNSNASPTADVFDVQTANGSSNFIQVTSTAANQGAVTIQSIGGSNALNLTSGSGTINIGATNLTGTGALTVAAGGTNQNIDVEASGTGSDSFGTSAHNKTVNIGAVGSTANTTTLNVATSTGAAQTVTLGSTNSSSSTTVQAGASSIGVTNSGITLTASGLSSGVVMASSGLLSTAASLAAASGGTGTDTSSSTGVPVINSGAWSVDGVLPLTLGGTNASLTASNGGIVYSNSTQLQVLSGTATSGQCLLSGSSAAPSWGACNTGDIVQAPTSTAQNTITPTTSGVVGLTVNGTNTGTAAVALQVTQAFVQTAVSITSSSTGDGENITLSNSSGTQTNGLSILKNVAGGTTTNLLNLAQADGIVTNALNISGNFTKLINSTNFSVTNAGALTAVGVNSGTGLLQGTGGLTLTGSVNINNNASTNTTNIGTGSTSGAISIGGGSDTLTINTTSWDVSSAGIASGLTGLSSSGTIAFGGLTTNGVVTTTGGTGTLSVVSSLGASQGGTGLSSYTVGDLLYASGSTALSSLSDVATGSCLISGGTSTAPSWGSCSAGNIVQVPGSTAQNTITPTVDNVVGLTVNGTSGVSATGLIVNQAGSADAMDINTSGSGNGLVVSQTNTSGTITSGLTITRNGTGGTTTNLLNLTAPHGTATNGITFSGTYTDLINAPNFTVGNGGTIDTAGGALLSGTITLNQNAAAHTVGIGTGTTTGAVSIGGGSDTLTINTTSWDVSSAGAASGLTGLSSSGTIAFGGLTTDGVVMATGGNGTLSTSATLGVSNGGTGLGSYTVGDLLYASGSTTLSALSDVTSGECLLSGGTGVAPAWGACPGGASGLVQVPGTTAQNTVTPTASSVVGLTVNGTSGTAATAVNIIQGGAATALTVGSSNTGNGEDISLTNTSGTQTSGLSITRNGSGGTTTNLLNLVQSAGTATNGLNFSGTFTNLINSTNFGVTNAGAVTAVGVNAGSGLLQGTGGISLSGSVSINNNAGTNATNIGIGSTTGAIAIGGGGDTLAINTSSWNASTAGALSGLTTISMSGAITAATTSNTINGLVINSGTISTGTWNGTAVGAAYGGTGQTSYTVGDILYASGTTTLSKLSDVATGSCLVSGGTSTAPSWGSCTQGLTYVQLAPSGVQTDSSTNSSIFINKTGSSGNILQLQKGGNTVLTVGNTGNTTFENSSDSTTAFQVQNHSGVNLFNVDTTTGLNTLYSLLATNGVTLDGATVVAGTTTINTTGSATTSIGNTSGGDVLIVGDTSSTALQLQVGSGGTLSLGNGGLASTVQIGNTTGAVTQTINLGNNNTASSVSNVTIGSQIGASTTTIQGGTGNIVLQASGSSNTGVLVKAANNSTAAFQIQNSTGTTLLNDDTTTGNLTVNQGTLTVGTVLPRPSQPTLTTAGTGGHLTANTYDYIFAYTTAAGTSAAVYANPNSVTTSGSASVNTVTWSAVTGATSYTIYRSANFGQTWFSNTVGSGVTSLVDDGLNYTWTNGATASSFNNAGDGYVTTAQGYQISGVSVLRVDGLAGGGLNAFVGAGSAGGTGSYGYNSALGYQALNSEGALAQKNSAVGYAALQGVTTGGYNTAVGALAGYNNGTGKVTTGSDNTFIGANTSFNAVAPQLSATTTLGFDATVGQSNAVTLGCTNTINGCNATSTVGIGSAGFAPNSLTVSASSYGTYGTTDTGTTISQTTTTITGSGTTFTAAMTGGTIYYSDGTIATVTYVSATSLTSSVSKTVAANSKYTIVYGGFNVTTTGSAFLQPSSNTATALEVLNTSNSAVFDVNTTSGCVVIKGTACTGSEALAVYGTVIASGTITASGSPDIAEYIPVASDVSAYDVVSAGPDGQVDAVQSSKAYDPTATGVISDGTSSFIANGEGNQPGEMPIVLAGRVPVHVTNMNGPVEPGDYLTTSPIPGYAMLATSPGPTIGKALAAFNSTSGTVMAQISNSYYAGSSSGSYIQNGGNATLTGLEVGGTADFSDLNASGISTINDLKVQTLAVAGNITVGGNLTVSGLTSVQDIQVGGHIITAGNTPVISVQSAAGTGGSPTCTVSGNDTAGLITLTTGTASWAAGSQCNLTFNSAFAATPHPVLTPTGATDSSLVGPTITASPTGFSVNFIHADTGQHTYTWDYFNVQ